LEAVLFQQPSDSEVCWKHQKDNAVECGCKASALTNATYTNNRTVPVEPSSLFSSCTVCIDGGEMLDPDREINLESQGLPIKNCRDLQGFAALLEEDGELCGGLRAISTYCGCEYVSDQACSLCADGSPASKPDRLVGGVASASWTAENVPKFFEPFVSILNCVSYPLAGVYSVPTTTAQVVASDTVLSINATLGIIRSNPSELRSKSF